METVFIYALEDPVTNEIRYIGKAKNIKDRMKHHYSPSKLKPKTYKNHWIKKLLGQNLKPNVLIIEEVELENWEERERYWIEQYKDALTNGTVGGEGTNGIIRSKETREKLSKALNNFYNTKEGDELKIKQSKANKGKIFSTDHKRKLSEAKTGLKRSKESIKKFLDIMRKRYIIVYMDNTEEIMEGQKEICKTFKLGYETFRKLRDGEKTNHKNIKEIKEWQ